MSKRVTDVTHVAKSALLELVVTGIRDIGQRDRYWSDDDGRVKTAGPNYVRMKASMEDNGGDRKHIQMSIDLPQSLARKFSVGGKLRITK